MSDNQIELLCGKLQVLLRHEILHGNSVEAAETGWSKVTLAVRMAKALDMEFVKKTAGADPDLEIWESRDVKNPAETGVLCKSARQSLSGKTKKQK
jgi:hypothetical protein